MLFDVRYFRDPQFSCRNYIPRYIYIHVTPRYWCDMYINKTTLLVKGTSFYWFVCIIKCVFMIYKWKLVHYYTHTWILLRIHDVSMRDLYDTYVIGNTGAQYVNAKTVA